MKNATASIHGIQYTNGQLLQDVIEQINIAMNHRFRYTFFEPLRQINSHLD